MLCCRIHLKRISIRPKRIRTAMIQRDENSVRDHRLSVCAVAYTMQRYGCMRGPAQIATKGRMRRAARSTGKPVARRTEPLGYASITASRDARSKDASETQLLLLPVLSPASPVERSRLEVSGNHAALGAGHRSPTARIALAGVSIGIPAGQWGGRRMTGRSTLFPSPAQ